MNRINQKLQENKKILSIYFSAGYPNLNDTVQIIQDLEKNGCAVMGLIDVLLSPHGWKYVSQEIRLWIVEQVPDARIISSLGRMDFGRR